MANGSRVRGRGYVRLVVLAVATAAVGVSGTSRLRADEVTDEIVDHPGFAKALRAFGSVTFDWRYPRDRRAHDRAEFKKDYWAAAVDVKLAADEAKAESDRYDRMWDDLNAVAERYDVAEVSFVGCDKFSLNRCLDLYYSANTPRGPIVFKFSVEVGVGDGVRVFGFEAVTGWDRVKQVLKAVEHQVPMSHTPTVSCPDELRSTTRP